MSDVKDKSSASDNSIEQQASRWLVRMQCDSSSDSDRAEHKAWLDANLMHRKAYLRLQSLWNTLGDFADRPEILAERKQARIKPSAVTLLPTAQTQEERVAEQEQIATKRPVPVYRTPDRSGLKWLPRAMAASLLMVVIGVGAFVQIISSSDPQNPNDYQTAVGEQKTVKLADGSTLTLDTQTSLSIDFTEQQRRIVLKQGQARFDVAHDKTRPFVVEANNGKITALGTAFVVRKTENQVLVTLLEGRVEVVQEDTPGMSDIGVIDQIVRTTDLDAINEHKRTAPVRVLEVGQQLVYTDMGISDTDNIDIDQATAWQQGRLIYENRSLSDVVEDLNRYSKRKILLGDASLELIRVNGVFKSGDNPKAIQALTSYFSMKVISDSEGNLVLYPNTDKLQDNLQNALR